MIPGHASLPTCIMRSSWLLLSMTVPSRPTMCEATAAGLRAGLGLLHPEPARLPPAGLPGEPARGAELHPNSVSST